jgi:Helix-turn-helix domain
MESAVESRGPFEGTIGRADQVLTTAGAAEFLGFSVRTLEFWRVKRKGPPYCRPSGSSIRYLRVDLIQWLTSHRVTVEAEAALGAGMGMAGGGMR